MLNFTLTAFFTTMPFVVMILLALGLCMLVFGCYSNPAVAMWSVMAVFLWEVTEIFLPGLNLGVYMYPTDIVFAILGLTGALRLMNKGRIRSIPKTWWVLGAVFTVSFLIGLAKFGSSAGVAFRNDFYFWVGTAYFATVPATRESLARFARVWLWSAIVTLLVVYYRWTADALDLDWFEPLWRHINQSSVVYRVVDSGQTLVLGQTLILLVYAMTGEGKLRHWLWLSPFLALTVVVLQHRSVWVATFVPVLLAIFIAGKARGKVARNLSAFAVVAAVVLTPLISSEGLGSVSTTVASSAQKGAQLDQGTFGFRVTLWQELLKSWSNSGVIAYAIGEPYGSDNTWIEYTTGREVSVAPHNYYVQTLIDGGVIGLIGLVATYLLALRWLGRDSNLLHSDVSAGAMFALLVCQLLYYIPYSPHYEQGIVFGLALSLVRDRLNGWRVPRLESSTE